MRISSLILACLFSVAALLAQKPQKRIFLTPKSNITTAEIAEGFSKYCYNIVLTQNQDKADYLLEAAETVSADQGTTHRHWHFTLMICRYRWSKTASRGFPTKESAFQHFHVYDLPWTEKVRRSDK